MTLNKTIWTDDNLLRRAFTWLTRIGVAPKFGTLPIAYYQQDQCKAIEEIEKLASAKGVSVDNLTCKGGMIYAKDGGKSVLLAMVVCGRIVAR